jgi:hypothetical protein
MALLPGSPAIGAGIAVPSVTTDQRGVLRPQGVAPDIGAFELQGSQPTIVGLRRLRSQRPATTLVLTFSEPMDAARAQKRANYRLVWDGSDHRLGTSDDRAIRIRWARYDAASHSVELRPIQRLARQRAYWLTVVGTPPGGLTSAAGVFLNGAGRLIP